MNPKPLVHVLVINWNGLEHLHACFESLILSSYTNAKFVLLDNASDDDSIAYVQDTFGTDPRVDIMALEDNLGWSGANNRGMQAALDAKTDYVLLLNNDTRVEPDFLEHLVSMAEADPTIGALSPRILMYDEPQIINSLGLEVSSIGGGWDKAIGRVDDVRWDTDEPIAGVCGAAMFLRSEALRSTGLLPTDFGIYLDDLDLCLRMWQQGYCIRLCYASVVFHKFSATMGSGKNARRKYYLNTRNRSRIALRHFPVRAWPGFARRLLKAECKAVGRGLLDGEFWKWGTHLRSWVDFVFYWPRAMAFRTSNHGHAPNATDVNTLIQYTQLFFPGVIFPVSGWYPQTELDGAVYRPMARYAQIEHSGGDLIVAMHPSSPGAVTVHDQSGHSYTLTNQGAENTTLTLAPGEVTFEAHAVTAHIQGNTTYDVGAWMTITQEGND